MDLKDKEHAGVVTGAKRFNQTQEHRCDLCGFKAHNSVYFCVVNGCGIPAERLQPSTNDYLVRQLSERFAFLKDMPKTELTKLKKEIHQLIKGDTMG